MKKLLKSVVAIALAACVCTADPVKKPLLEAIFKKQGRTLE